MLSRPTVTRRQFLRTAAISSAATAMTAKSYARIIGANERVNFGLLGFGLLGFGLLGFGLIGRVHTQTFAALREAHIAAVSDAFTPRMAACRELAADATAHADFRKLLERKDVDAVIVATPDHWHALHTMMACAAGKDVYVEKPTHLFVREGEWMQRVAARHGRVIQVGTQQRSGPHYQRAKDLLRNGAIGDIVSVQCDFFRNISPGIGRPPDSAPPAGFDWDMHLGPAPARPYNPNRGLYHFRWFWDTAGGQMTNLAHHSLDIVHWIFDLKAPRAVSSQGGRWFLQDNGETPDTQNAIIEYDKFPVVVQIREAAAGGGLASGALVFIGTKGRLKIDRTGFEITPDRKALAQNIVAAIGVHPVGGPQRVDEPKDQKWCEPLTDKTGVSAEQYTRHAQNFIDCIKSRQTPVSDLESGHWVSTACHLANLSLQTERKLSWDAATNDLRSDREASARLQRAYRAPWAAELKALLT